MRAPLITTLLLTAIAAPLVAGEAIDTASETDRISYTIGHQIGTDFKRQELGLDEAALVGGIEDAQQGASPQLPKDEMQELLVDLKRRITNDMKAEATQRLQAKRDDEMAKRAAGKAFLEKNAKQPGVKTLPSRLQYKVLRAGNGRKPRSGDMVTINYRASRLDGQEFDSTEKKGAPATLRVDGTFPGLTEALMMMPQGSKWTLYVPEDLAYGRQGPLAHQTIIFEVELLEVTSPQAKTGNAGKAD